MKPIKLAFLVTDNHLESFKRTFIKQLSDTTSKMYIPPSGKITVTLYQTLRKNLIVYTNIR